MPDQLAIDIEVTKRLVKLLEDAQELRAFCSAKGVAIPAPLARFLGEGSTPGSKPSGSRMTIPAPSHPDHPPGASASWIWVDEADATVMTLVLSLLRQATAPMTPSDLHNELIKKRPAQNKGSIANLGTRLSDEEVISRNENGEWTLVKQEAAPVMYRGYLWGPPEAFQVTDAASYRRGAIRHILSTTPDGLQIMQLTNTLKESCAWYNQSVPVTKDLIKTDIAELNTKKIVRQVGHSGKWELVK